MKKILCKLEKEDTNDLFILMSNIQTFITLRTIYIANHRDDLIPDIEEKILCARDNLNKRNLELLEKYSAPFYVDKKLHIDINNRTIFIYE